MSDNFFRALEFFAKEHELTYFGLPENVDPNNMRNREFVYVHGTKVFLTMEAMFPDYDPSQTFMTMIENLPSDGISMMIFHPGYLDDFILKNSSLLIPRTQEVEMLIHPKWKKILKEKNIECVDFRDL